MRTCVCLAFASDIKPVAVGATSAVPVMPALLCCAQAAKPLPAWSCLQKVWKGCTYFCGAVCARVGTGMQN